MKLLKREFKDKVKKTLFELDWELNRGIEEGKLVGPYVHKLEIKLVGHCQHRHPPVLKKY
jgi:hypothetical protein